MSNARLMLLPLLVACGGKDPIVPPPGTGTGTGTGTGGGAIESNCSNGLDDDGDGLLDCEDSDCAGSAACVEVACDDGEDNDGDGYFDCADADCWGNGCAVTQARITSAGTVDWKEASLDFATATPGCSSYHLDTATIELASPVGKVRYMSPSASDWTTCDWSATRSWVLDVNTASPFSNPRLLRREGFTIDAACPIQDARFLPLVVTLDSGTGMWALRTGAGGNGPPWFGMTGAPVPVDSTYVNNGPVGSCNHFITGDRQTVSWSNADVSFDFLIAAPTLEPPATGTGTGTGTGYP